jgi:hypothetical protein
LSERFAVAFTPRASREVAEAERWWRANRSKAPNALEEELRTALDLISTTPAVGAVARNVALPGVRRIFLNRVNYFLYYRPNSESRIVEITALMRGAVWGHACSTSSRPLCNENMVDRKAGSEFRMSRDMRCLVRSAGESPRNGEGSDAGAEQRGAAARSRFVGCRARSPDLHHFNSGATTSSTARPAIRSAIHWCSAMSLVVVV